MSPCFLNGGFRHRKLGDFLAIVHDGHGFARLSALKQFGEAFFGFLGIDCMASLPIGFERYVSPLSCATGRRSG